MDTFTGIVLSLVPVIVIVALITVPIWIVKVLMKKKPTNDKDKGEK